MEPEQTPSQAMMAANQAERAAAVAEAERLRADNAALRTELAQLREALVRLEKLLETLQDSLSKDSHNSSKPPSSDGPGAAPRQPKPPTGRKRGGQPGHKGKTRSALPEGSESRMVAVPLTTCPHCSHTMPREAITGTQVERVLDLVKELTEVTAFHIEEGCCPHCHQHVRAPLPPEVGAGDLGPCLRALAAYLRIEGKMSIGTLHAFFNEILQIEVSRDWLFDACIALGQAVEPVYEDLRQDIRHSLFVNMDETGFGRQERNWIWTALAARMAFFHFGTTRGYQALRAIFPEDFADVLCTDRYAAYHKLKKAVRQYCWAHLRRDIIALTESGNARVEVIAKRMLTDQESLYVWWRQFRDGALDRRDLGAQTALILARFKRNFQALAEAKNKKARTFGASLSENWDHLWMFLKVEGVEPSNNAAYAASRIRPRVILDSMPHAG
jgi:transposase